MRNKYGKNGNFWYNENYRNERIEKERCFVAYLSHWCNEIKGGSDEHIVFERKFKQKIYFCGQDFPDDEFAVIFERMKAYDTIVIGSPIYWHNLCASVRNLLDRFHVEVKPGALAGKKLFLVCQGAAPEQWMLEAGEYTISRFGLLYGMEYIGMVKNRTDADRLAEQL